MHIDRHRCSFIGIDILAVLEDVEDVKIQISIHNEHKFRKFL